MHFCYLLHMHVRPTPRAMLSLKYSALRARMHMKLQRCTCVMRFLMAHCSAPHCGRQKAAGYSRKRGAVCQRRDSTTGSRAARIHRKVVPMHSAPGSTLCSVLLCSSHKYTCSTHAVKYTTHKYTGSTHMLHCAVLP